MWASKETFTTTSSLWAPFLQFLQETKCNIFPSNAIRKASQLKQNRYKVDGFPI